MNNQYLSTIEQFNRQRILVIGETFLDAYLFGHVDRICREAPVPVVDIDKSMYAPGGAANVAKNLAELGANITFLSVIGQDEEGQLVLNELIKSDISTESIIRDLKRQSIAKKRVIANQQILMRFDAGTIERLEGKVEREFIISLIEAWKEVDAVIISDYGYGIFTDEVIHIIEKLQNALPKIIVIDSKQIERYQPIRASVIKPNYNESLSLLGITKKEYGEERINQIISYRDNFFSKSNATYISVTLDSEGAVIFDKDSLLYRTYAKRIENAQVSGAGDTYTAVLALSLSANADMKTAAEIAAKATSIVVTKEGTASCTRNELQAAFTSNEKLLSNRNFLENKVNELRAFGKKIVFSNGCFDILHSGHVSYLNKAKSYGDILMLGLNTDESITRLKGKDRPINSLTDRTQVLSSLSAIDFVIPMPEDTAEELIRIIQPDIYVKGGDYTPETLPEAKIVTSYGGKVKIIPLIEGKSTSRIITKIRETYPNQKNSFI